MKNIIIAFWEYLHIILSYDEFLKGTNTEGTKNAKLKEGRNIEKLLSREEERLVSFPTTLQT